MSGPELPTTGWEATTQRDSVYVFTHVMSDARVSGEQETTANCDFTEDGEAVIGDCWGTLTIENDGGTWDGTWTGTTTFSLSEPDHVHVIDSTLVGTGDYDGPPLCDGGRGKRLPLGHHGSHRTGERAAGRSGAMGRVRTAGRRVARYSARRGRRAMRRPPPHRPSTPGPDARPAWCGSTSVHRSSSTTSAPCVGSARSGGDRGRSRVVPSSARRSIRPRSRCAARRPRASRSRSPVASATTASRNRVSWSFAIA